MDKQLWFDSILPRLMVVVIPLAVSVAIISHGYDGDPFLRGDCPYYYWTARALLREHSFALGKELPGSPQSHAGQVSLAANGALVPKHPVVLPILSLPFIGLLEERGALAFNLLQVLALLGVTYSLARQTAKTLAASTAVLITFLAGPLPHYVWNYSPDVCSTLLLVGGAVAAVKARNHKWIAASGFLFGLACVSKFPLILFVPASLLLLPRVRAAVPFLVGFFLPLGLFAIYNAALFGSPFVTSYDRITVVDAAGHWSTFSQRSNFDLPFLQGLRGQFINRRHGLLFTSVATLVALAGIPALLKRNARLGAFIILGSIGLIGFFSRYDQWNASHYGNRFLFPVIALMTVPFAILLESGYTRTSMLMSRPQPEHRN